jgi:hypothetical protein
MTHTTALVGERMVTTWLTEANGTFGKVTMFINKTLECLVCKMHGRNQKCIKTLQTFGLNA